MKYITVLFLFISSCASQLPKYTVMITNLKENHGGSGSIVYNSPSFSVVLTNGHVCQIIKNGGKVISDKGLRYSIDWYKLSNLHDLCLVYVSQDLKYHAELSPYPPAAYDDALVVGHPLLMPTIMSPGHFSGRQVINVTMGTRECTDIEKYSLQVGRMCAFVGAVPLIKNLEAISTSCLIMPGSSGSAVFGSDGKIQAVIFSGLDDMSYGYAVPWEYIYNFLQVEEKTLRAIKVDSSLYFKKLELDSGEINERYEGFCSPETNIDYKKLSGVELAICEMVQKSSSFSDLVERKK